MAEEFGKIKCKTISFEKSFNNTFYFYKFRKHNTAGRTPYRTMKT